jgi:hypothetical protein
MRIVGVGRDLFEILCVREGHLPSVAASARRGASVDTVECLEAMLVGCPFPI